MTTHTEVSAFSFRRLLEVPDGRYKNYILSDSRHTGLMAFLRRQMEGRPRLRALDVGCGAGIISRGLAGEFEQVLGVDGNADNVALAQSLTRDAGIKNAAFRHADATGLPADDRSFDLVVVVGVLEWVGVNDAGEHPRARQMRMLREIHRVLKPGGTFYLAIENRWHPRSMLRDPHSGLLLADGLPRWLAHLVSKASKGTPYQTYIYGWRSLRRMLRTAGFNDATPYVPFPGYQQPVSHITLHPRRRALEDIAAIDVPTVGRVLEQAGRPRSVQSAVDALTRRASLGLLGLLCHDLAFVCKKK
ncbi:MAG TPA: methyltransferase domain-containing protein [Gammaproteobacteria bacterium]|nr:methyltransferase domain-containing protein [Gammaproteobacteria bacterium]